jgi:hypothetical protein
VRTFPLRWICRGHRAKLAFVGRAWTPVWLLVVGVIDGDGSSQMKPAVGCFVLHQLCSNMPITGSLLPVVKRVVGQLIGSAYLCVAPSCVGSRCWIWDSSAACAWRPY